jgi:copper chaperone
MSQTMKIEIDNLKCGGCAATILKGLNSIDGVSQVKVDPVAHAVELKAPASLRSAVIEQLRQMGYPEKGTMSGIQAGLANAKSYVSCAIGRMA